MVGGEKPYLVTILKQTWTTNANETSNKTIEKNYLMKKNILCERKGLQRFIKNVPMHECFPELP